jgi:hypothetical protein
MYSSEFMMDSNHALLIGRIVELSHRLEFGEKHILVEVG